MFFAFLSALVRAPAANQMGGIKLSPVHTSTETKSTYKSRINQTHTDNNKVKMLQNCTYLFFLFGPRGSSTSGGGGTGGGSRGARVALPSPAKVGLFALEARVVSQFVLQMSIGWI